MDIQTRLRQAARFTRLDADKELLTEAADALDRREGVIKMLERDLLNQPPPILPTVPAGYVLVPIVPTKEILAAGDAEDHWHTELIYAAMLTAAKAQKGQQ